MSFVLKTNLILKKNLHNYNYSFKTHFYILIEQQVRNIWYCQLLPSCKREVPNLFIRETTVSYFSLCHKKQNTLILAFRSVLIQKQICFKNITQNNRQIG